MNNNNAWWKSIFPKENSPKNPHSATCAILMDE
jgi:hypothetical protein